VGKNRLERERSVEREVVSGVTKSVGAISGNSAAHAPLTRSAHFRHTTLICFLLLVQNGLRVRRPVDSSLYGTLVPSRASRRWMHLSLLASTHSSLQSGQKVRTGPDFQNSFTVGKCRKCPTEIM